MLALTSVTLVLLGSDSTEDEFLKAEYPKCSDTGVQYVCNVEEPNPVPKAEPRSTSTGVIVGGIAAGVVVILIAAFAYTQCGSK